MIKDNGGDQNVHTAVSLHIGSNGVKIESTRKLRISSSSTITLATRLRFIHFIWQSTTQVNTEQPIDNNIHRGRS